MHCCQFCSFFSTARTDVLKHLKASHVNEPGFFINCLLCARTFRVFSSFTSHVSRCHPGIAVEKAYDSKITKHLTNQVEFEEQQNSFDCNIDDSDRSTTNHEAAQLEPRVDHYDLVSSAGNFIVGLKEVHLVCIFYHIDWHKSNIYVFIFTLKVTQSCVDYVIEGVTNLSDTIIGICRDKVAHVLEQHGTTIEDSNLDEVFDDCRHPFENLQTAYLQAQYIKKQLSYVVCINYFFYNINHLYAYFLIYFIFCNVQEPIEIKLGSRWVTDKKVKNSGNLIQKDDKFVYVPILQTLQQLINNDSIRKEVRIK